MEVKAMCDVDVGFSVDCVSCEDSAVYPDAMTAQQEDWVYHGQGRWTCPVCVKRSKGEEVESAIDDF